MFLDDLKFDSNLFDKHFLIYLNNDFDNIKFKINESGISRGYIRVFHLSNDIKITIFKFKNSDYTLTIKPNNKIFNKGDVSIKINDNISIKEFKKIYYSNIIYLSNLSESIESTDKFISKKYNLELKAKFIIDQNNFFFLSSGERTRLYKYRFDKKNGFFMNSNDEHKDNISEQILEKLNYHYLIVPRNKKLDKIIKKMEMGDK